MGFDKLAEFTRSLEKNGEAMKVAKALRVFNDEAERAQLEKVAQANDEMLVKVAEMLDAQTEAFEYMLEKFAESVLAATGDASTPLTASPVENVLQGSEDANKAPVMTADLVEKGAKEAIESPHVDTADGVAGVVHAVAKLNGPEQAPAAADIVKEVVRQAVSNKVIPPEEGTAAADAADAAAMSATAATGE